MKGKFLHFLRSLGFYHGPISYGMKVKTGHIFGKGSS